MRGRVDIDLEKDPPPDLALEIDLTSKSLPRLPIYLRLGVPEIWCYDEGQLSIRIFPQLEIRALPQLMEQYRQAGHRAVRKAIRQWVREQV